MTARWLLLVHQLPPKPLYLRAKVRQRLERVGALPVKNSVYVLPRSDDALEDLQWIAQEARAGGGEAWIAEGTFLDGLDDGALVARFRKARAADWDALAAELRELLARRGGRDAPERAATAARLVRRAEELRAIDFFDAPGKKEVKAMLEKLEGKGRAADSAAERRKRADFVGKTWVTRRGVKVDRISSAWLVRRFLDPAARFRFVDPAADSRRPGELRFDMVGGDFTHEGDRCTFETLCARAALDDPPIATIGEIVHDIDLKDGKYGRPEAAGVRQLLDGILAACPTDEERLERGFALFDDLLVSFARRSKDDAPREAKTRGARGHAPTRSRKRSR